MATTTFDKNITIDKAAAERLVEILSKPAPPRPNIEKDFWDKYDERDNYLQMIRRLQ